MKKKLLIVAVALVLVVSSVSLIACSNKDRDIYPAWVYENTWDAEQEQLAVPEGANVRIMTYNVLVEAWNSNMKTGISNPMDARVEQVAKTIEHYSPDVIAIQEMCEKWHGKLPKKLKENFSMVKEFNGMFEYTSMMYNHKKVTPIEMGKVKYSKRSEGKMRYAAWTLFEKNDTKAKFIVMNTHFDFGKEKVEMQTVQMKEYGDLGKELQVKYKVPVFLAGDYNAYESEITDKDHPAFDWNQGVEHYNKFVADHSDAFVDSNYIDSAVKIGGEHRAYNEPKWDHIFVSKDIEVMKYVILSNDFYSSASDHFPVFIDAKIA